MFDKILPKLLELEKKVGAMQTHVNGINGLSKRFDSDKDAYPDENEDKGWKCAKCSTFIGFFDEEDQQFRFKYKGLVIYLSPGDNGSITIICNNCSYANNLGYFSCENEI